MSALSVINQKLINSQQNFDSQQNHSSNFASALLSKTQITSQTEPQTLIHQKRNDESVERSAKRKKISEEYTPFEKRSLYKRPKFITSSDKITLNPENLLTRGSYKLIYSGKLVQDEKEFDIVALEMISKKNKTIVSDEINMSLTETNISSHQYGEAAEIPYLGTTEINDTTYLIAEKATLPFQIQAGDIEQLTENYLTIAHDLHTRALQKTLSKFIGVDRKLCNAVTLGSEITHPGKVFEIDFPTYKTEHDKQLPNGTPKFNSPIYNEYIIARGKFKIQYDRVYELNQTITAGQQQLNTVFNNNGDYINRSLTILKNLLSTENSKLEKLENEMNEKHKNLWTKESIELTNSWTYGSMILAGSISILDAIKQIETQFDDLSLSETDAIKINKNKDMFSKQHFQFYSADKYKLYASAINKLRGSIDKYYVKENQLHLSANLDFKKDIPSLIHLITNYQNEILNHFQELDDIDNSKLKIYSSQIIALKVMNGDITLEEAHNENNLLRSKQINCLLVNRFESDGNTDSDGAISDSDSKISIDS